MPNLEQFETREDFNKWYSTYRKNKSWKEYHTKYNREWRKRNTIFKDLVRRKVFMALKNGLIKKGKCEICESFEVEAHHDDYSKPLDIRWFCRKHHRAHDVATGKRKY